MAGDWIKMRTDLYRDPKVCVMAEMLTDEDSELARYVSQNRQRDMTVTRNVVRNAVVGALVAVWGVARHRGRRVDDHLVIRNATIYILDDIADLPGFGDAMLEVGWVEVTDDGLVFPNFFEEFNVEPDADKRAKAAERQRQFRERRNALRNATVAQESNDREEKRREEKRTTNTEEGASQNEVPIPLSEPPPALPEPPPAKPKRVRPPRPAFVKPTLEEVTAYCQEINANIDPQYWIDHYDANGWRVGNNPMADWKATVRNWNKRNVPVAQPPSPASRGSPDDRTARLQAEGQRALEILANGLPDPFGINYDANAS